MDLVRAGRPGRAPVPSRFRQAFKAGMAPQVILESTHENVLKFVSIEALKGHALDLH
jgi:uncharacterized protein (DUF2237 family)